MGVALVAAPHVGRVNHHGVAGADWVEQVDALDVIGLQAHLFRVRVSLGLAYLASVRVDVGLV